jgi:hypothetical protein
MRLIFVKELVAPTGEASQSRGGIGKMRTFRRSELTRRSFVGAALASSALALPAIAAAQELPAGSAVALQPGMRVVWFGGAASIPGVREQLEPNVNGEWVNKRTGERYTEFPTPGAGAMGFVVIDVLDAEPTGFVLWVTTLLAHADFGGTSTFIDVNGLVANATNIADYWVSPAQLAGLADRHEASFRVLHMPYNLDGRVYRAVRIQSESGGGWNQNTYDLDTGLCIATGSTTQGRPVLTLGPENTITTGPGSTQLTFTRLAGVRGTSLPGPGEAYPDAVRRLRSFTYSGAKTVVTGGQPYTFPFELRYDVIANPGPYLNARMSVAGTAAAQDRVIAAGVIGSVWMNPETLAGYAGGEILDQDPVTGMEAAVAGRQDGSVVIALQTPLTRHSFAYDLRSGLLVSAELGQQIGIVTDTVTVQLTGVQ